MGYKFSNDQINRLKSLYPDISVNQVGCIERYIDLILDANQRINLIGSSTVANIFQRHILDCMQLIGKINGASNIIDLGSGSGLPGLLLSIVLPDSNFYLIEKSKLKADFLHDVIDKLDLRNVRVFNGDIYSGLNDFIKIKNKLIVSRAFKSLYDIFFIAHKINADKALLLKGKKYPNEILEAKKKFGFVCDSSKSIVHEDGIVLDCREISLL